MREMWEVRASDRRGYERLCKVLPSVSGQLDD